MDYMIKHPLAQLLNAPLPQPLQPVRNPALAADVINMGGRYESFADIPAVKIEPKSDPSPAPSATSAVKKSQPAVSQATELKVREAEAAHKLPTLAPQQHPKLAGVRPYTPSGYIDPGFFYKGKFYPIRQQLQQHGKKVIWGVSMGTIAGIILLLALGIMLGQWLF